MLLKSLHGWVAERFKAPVLKAEHSLASLSAQLAKLP
jgi:hypothetical protein